MIGWFKNISKISKKPTHFFFFYYSMTQRNREPRDRYRELEYEILDERESLSLHFSSLFLIIICLTTTKIKLYED